MSRTRGAGIRFGRGDVWNAEDVAKLREILRTRGRLAVFEAFPSRSRYSIKNQIARQQTLYPELQSTRIRYRTDVVAEPVYDRTLPRFDTSTFIERLLSGAPRRRSA